MKQIGLTGYALSHSFSPAYFKAKFEQLNIRSVEYGLYPIENIELLPLLLEREKDLIALNVTIPYKTSILSQVHQISPEVEACHAANLILIDRNKEIKLSAYNTDVYGFTESLKPWYTGMLRKALILGNGGASKAVQYALKQLNIPFEIAGRNLPLKFSKVSFAEIDLVINCTPVGMEKKSSKPLKTKLRLPYKEIRSDMYYYDLVYNPLETEMMQLFQARGAKVKNGLEMLHLQADRSWEIIREAFQITE